MTKTTNQLADAIREVTVTMQKAIADRHRSHVIDAATTGSPTIPTACTPAAVAGGSTGSPDDQPVRRAVVFSWGTGPLSGSQ